MALLTDGPPHPLDVSPDALKALELVMLAQAQECVLEKAMGGAAPGEPPSKASEGALARVSSGEWHQSGDWKEGIWWQFNDEPNTNKL